VMRGAPVGFRESLLSEGSSSAISLVADAEQFFDGSTLWVEIDQRVEPFQKLAQQGHRFRGPLSK
jgi:hypothetical protein